MHGQRTQRLFIAHVHIQAAQALAVLRLQFQQAGGLTSVAGDGPHISTISARQQLRGEGQTDPAAGAADYGMRRFFQALPKAHRITPAPLRRSVAGHGRSVVEESR
jgi:hypothetical protein